MNAHDALLEHLIETYPKSCAFWKVTLDGNLAQHLALTMAGFTETKSRAENCALLVLGYLNEHD